MKHYFDPFTAAASIPAEIANDDGPAILSDTELRKAALTYVLNPSVFNAIELEGLAHSKDFDEADVKLLVEETRAQIEAVQRRALDTPPEHHA